MSAKNRLPNSKLLAQAGSVETFASFGRRVRHWALVAALFALLLVISTCGWLMRVELK